ncbi:MAG: putative 4 fimbrial pilE-related [Gammaproteobacteria bacterium]|nr:putative 4 fimbrial pilE-related [Gammaproteobacteria bacterium]
MTILSGRTRAAGFSLVELMITIVIGAILVSIAVPAYTTQIRKTRRTEARTAILDLASREERFYSVNNAYTDQQANLGYGAAGAVSGTSVGSGYYTVTVTFTAADVTTAPPTQATYTIKASAAGIQAKDTDCASFTVQETGKTSSLNSAGTDSTALCWK